MSEDGPSKKEGGCRSEVRQSEGVKIYFDPVSTAAREESARELAAKVLADPARKDSINTVLSPCHEHVSSPKAKRENWNYIKASSTNAVRT